MRRQSLKLLTSLAYAKGAYTVAIEIGSAGRSAQLLLDTGSSALAVLSHAYDGAADTYLRGTTLAQRVEYGQGAWAGPVLRSTVAFAARLAAAIHTGTAADEWPLLHFRPPCRR